MTRLYLRKNDYFWLRVAALDDPGFMPGCAWAAGAPVFERLIGRGYVERQEFRRDSRHGDPRIHVRAVTTAKGRREIEAQRARNLAARENAEATTP